MNKYSWTPMRCARICTIILIISSFLFLFLIFSCPELKFQYTSCTSTNSPCCQNIYHPGKSIKLFFCVFLVFYNYFYLVCYTNDSHKMFLSPCHFGCTNQTILNDNNVYYSSCNCAQDAVLTETACRFRQIPCKKSIRKKKRLSNHIHL
jgi:hypothetical protein